MICTEVLFFKECELISYINSPLLIVVCFLLFFSSMCDRVCGSCKYTVELRGAEKHPGALRF